MSEKENKSIIEKLIAINSKPTQDSFPELPNALVWSELPNIVSCLYVILITLPLIIIFHISYLLFFSTSALWTGCNLWWMAKTFKPFKRRNWSADGHQFNYLCPFHLL
jgi:hypothetical protein